MSDLIFNKFLETWGFTKTISVGLIAITGAAISGYLAATFIPDNPESTRINNEKESIDHE